MTNRSFVFAVLLLSPVVGNSATPQQPLIAQPDQMIPGRPSVSGNTPEKPKYISVSIIPNGSLSSVLLNLGVEPTLRKTEALRQYNNLASPLLEIGDVIRVPTYLVANSMVTTAAQFSSENNPDYCGLTICFDETIAGEEQDSPEPDKEIADKEITETATEVFFTAKPVATPRPVVTPPLRSSASEQTETTEPEKPSSDTEATADKPVATQPQRTNASEQSEASKPRTPSPENEATTNKPVAPPAVPGTQSPRIEKAEPPTQAPEIQKPTLNTPKETDKPPAQEPPKPRPAPGLFEVDEDAATRALERSLVSINALLLESRQVETSLDFSLAYDLTKRAELVEITNEGESTNNVGEIENIRTIYGANLGVAFGLPGDAQIRFQLPLQKTSSESNVLVSNTEIDGVSANATGAGDMTISLAKTLAQEQGRRPDIIAQVTYDSDWGNSDNGIQLGDNLESLELGLRATKRQDPLVFTYGISRSFPIEKDSFKAGAITRLSASTLLAASPYTSLIFSFNHTVIDSASLNGATIRGSKAIDSSLNIGVSSVIGTATFMSAGVVAGLTEASNDYSAYVSFSKRFSF